MRPRRVARAALALALVSALASLGVARGDRSASTVGAGGSRSDEATRESPSPGPHQGAPLPPFPTEADTAFAAWLASKGGAFTGAGVWSYVETGHATGDPSIVTGRNRGVFAKDAPVENGDVLVEMRLDAALTVPSERAGSILNAVARQVDPEWALAMLLLRESNLGPSGPYAPFLRMALGVESDAATRPEGSLATDDVRATALTNDAVAALNGTFAGAFHDALVRKDRVTFSRVRAMTVGTFPAAFPERLFGDFSRVAKALATVREKGARFPVAYRDSRTFETAAALVPIAHALPHDPRGAEPCVGVVEDVSRDASDRRTSLKLVVRVAAGAPGEELRCNRGAASAVAIDGSSARSASSSPGTREDRSARSVFWSDASIGTNLSDDGALFRFASAAATGALTDAEAAFRFGGVGVGRNARDAVALTLAEPSADDVASESGVSGETQKRAAASRASLLARCGPEKARALTRDGPSDELWCAVRVATADDSEAVSLFRRLEENDASDAADAATRGDEPRAAAMLRNAPVSDAAEARALAALLETTAAILDGYPTSDARDEALLRRAARARGEEAFSKTENEEDEEDEEDEEEDGQNLADDVAEAVRCRLREKRLLIDALNTLQRAASLTLTGGVRLDVVAGDGAAAESNAAKSNAAKSPPGGFEVRKAKYEKEL